MRRYFLDESGHGGDLAAAADLGFADQPFFSLACVGVVDEEALIGELAAIARRHRCGEGELKASAVGGRLGAISEELVEWLTEAGGALFVELVEKRHFVAIHVVNYLLCGPYGLEEVDQSSRSALVEEMSAARYDEALTMFLRSCRSTQLTDLSATMGLMWEAFNDSDDDAARYGQLLVMHARDRIGLPNAAAEDFLPIADRGPGGRSVWMLPNLQCLTNVYARMNRSRRDLEDLELVHDEQLQYGGILEDAKALMETLSSEDALPWVPFADYRLRGRARLSFTSGATEPCLQAADLIAGCAMRFGRSALRRRDRGVDLREAFLTMLSMSDPLAATGVNMVVSDALLRRLDIPHFAAAPMVRGRRRPG